MPTTCVADSAYESDVVAYRHDFRRYLRDLPEADEWRTATSDDTVTELAVDGRIMGRLYADGWNRYGWPRAAGGFGGTDLHRSVYYDEIAHATLHVPAQHFTLETLGPALVKFAPALAEEHLSALLAGKYWFGQGFSEPDAGSDLAALRCRANIVGADVVINGQKVWTSQGPTATKFLVLVRTGTAESRHRGLTTVLVDADAPGVTVRPIALASGREELAEIFFDDVRMPLTRVVGDIDGGWGVAMHLMQWERGMYGYAVLADALSTLSNLRDLMVRTNASDAHADRFVRVYLDVVTAQSRCARTVRALAAQESIGVHSSVDKLLFSEAEKTVADLVMDVVRPQMMAGSGDDIDAVRARWWYSRAATIMGGTAQIQRDVIADHLLGLPKRSGK